jgi:hypothetical protein
MIRRLGISMVTFALAAGLVACGQSAAAPIGNTGAAAATPPAGRGGRGGGGGPNVFGTVQTINGSTLTVQNQRDSSTVTVQLDSSTTIRKQVQGALSDAKAGDNIFAVGQESNGVLQARQIQLGAGFGGGPGNGQGQANGRAASGTPGPGGAAGGNATSVRGTVDSVSTDTVTVKTNTGTSEQVRLAANGRVIEQSTATAADIKQGDLVIATGQQQGNTLTATTVTLTVGRPNGGNGTAGNGNAPASNGNASTGSGA